MQMTAREWRPQAVIHLVRPTACVMNTIKTQPANNY